MDGELTAGTTADAAAGANRDIRAGIIMIACAVALTVLTSILRPGGAVIFGFGLLIAGVVALARGIKARR